MNFSHDKILKHKVKRVTRHMKPQKTSANLV